MATFGDILSSLTLAAGESVRRNAGNTAFEAYTPSTGGMTIGNAVTGGGANRVLYEDGSQNLAATARFTFSGDQLAVKARMDQTTASVLIQPDFNSSYYGATAHSAFTIDGYTGGFGSYGLYTSPEKRLLKIIDVLNSEVVAVEQYGTIVSNMQTDPGNAHVATYGWKITGDGSSAFYASNVFDVFRITGSNLSNHGAYSSGTVWLARIDDGTNDFFRIHRDGKTYLPNGSVSIGIASGSTISAALHITKTTEQIRTAYDGSNYFSTVVASNGAVTLDAVGSGAAFAFSDNVAINGSLTLSAQNIVTDTSTGMKIGTGTTQKLGFFNATPVVQRTDSGALTDSTGGSVTEQINEVSATYDEAEHNANYASLTAKINALRTALRDLGLMA
ncbi:MAG: hypothetical protein E6Q97_24035 [Desulfurellales bacterium]|nr:MAG: hypothetical protein E6Q97_24035 [Desulfurellales bacterium]